MRDALYKNNSNEIILKIHNLRFILIIIMCYN